MPSRDAQRVLATIKHNIVLARQFLADQTPDAFADNAMAVYAVTHCLEIISEASRRLPEDMKQRQATRRSAGDADWLPGPSVDLPATATDEFIQRKYRNDRQLSA